MLKKIPLILYFACAISVSAQENQDNQNNPPQNNEDDQSKVTFQGDSPRSNPRWYKSKEARQEYLKGGGDYPKNTSLDNPSSKKDPRYYKNSTSKS